MEEKPKRLLAIKTLQFSVCRVTQIPRACRTQIVIKLTDNNSGQSVQVEKKGAREQVTITADN